MNVSLAAINVLWNAADLLTRRSIHSLHNKPNGVSHGTTPNGNLPQTDLLDTQQFEDLLRFLFQAIQVSAICSTPRLADCLFG